MTVTFTTLQERPDLRADPDGVDPFADSWPVFMQKNRTAWLYYAFLEHWLPYVTVALDGDELIGKGYTVGFAWPTPDRPDLPEGGWESVIRWAHADRLAGVTPTACSALEAVITPSHKGRGIAAPLLGAMRENTRALGYEALLAPVRPSRKSDHPAESMADYVARRREDGLPVDPWLRLHERAGGEVLGVCPLSMTMSGTLAQWREWTGLPFDGDGHQEVPGALTPVMVDQAQGHAVYVEPNVWVRHPLTD